MRDSADNCGTQKSSSLLLLSALVFFICWLQIAAINPGISPLIFLPKMRGAAPQTADAVFLISLAAGALIFILFIGENFGNSVFALLSAIWLSVWVCLFFNSSPQALIWLLLLLGILSGLIMAYLIYHLIFYVPSMPWVKIVAFSYLAVRLITYACLFINLRTMLIAAYFFGSALQVGCIITAMLFKGDITQLRRRIPENHLQLKTIFPSLLMLLGIILSFSILKDVISPVAAGSGTADYFEILPDLLTLLFFIFRGYRLKRIDFIKIGAVLFGLAFIASQILEGSFITVYAIDILSRPATLFTDVFIFSFIGDFTFKYSRSSLRGRLVFLITVLSIPLADAFSSLVVSRLYLLDPNLLSVFYILFFFVIVMLPGLDAFFKNEFPQPEGDGNAEFVPYRLQVLNDYEAVQEYTEEHTALKIAELAQTVRLTHRETQVLELLFKKQESDVIAGQLGISSNTLKTHLKNIYSKLDVKSRNELYSLVETSAGPDSQLTGREKQILSSLKAGKSIHDIAEELFISVKTVNVHIWNICNKYGVKNIQELKDRSLRH